MREERKKCFYALVGGRRLSTCYHTGEVKAVCVL